MSAATVTAFKTKPAPQGAAKPKRTRAHKALRRQAMSAGVVGGIATALTGLSLTHLAHGVEIVTHCSTTEAYLMAFGIDVGYISAEMSHVMASSKKLADKLAKFTRWIVCGSLVGSAAMNAFAFAGQAEGYVMQAAGIVLGCAIPALIYALTRVAAAIYIDCNTRA